MARGIDPKENEETEEKIIHVLDEETLEESINEENQEEIQEETYEEQIVDDAQSINDIEVIDFTHVIDKEEFFDENNVEEVSDVELEENNSINWSLFEQDKAEELSTEEKINDAVDVNQIEVVDYIELIPTEEKNEIGEVIHEIEDHLLFESL